MKHYYIPTSSLNFNNIFSSESISPAAFYKERGFGYGRWSAIPENEHPNITILYERPHSFTRPDSGLEDHPMLVEIRTDEKFNTLGDGVFYTDHTLYLNPWNTRIWFFTEKDLITAKSLSDSSLETKLLRLYQKQFCVGRFPGKYVIPQVGDELVLNTNAIGEDKRINRLKGLLYGYYIGACKSVSQQVAESFHALYDIQDTFIAIALSSDKLASASQRDILKKAFDVLKKHDDFYQSFVAIARSAEVADAILQFLNDYKVETPLRDYDVEHHIDQLRRNQSDNNPSMMWVKKRILDLEYKSEKTMQLLSTDKSEIVITGCSQFSLKGIQDETLKNLLFTWVKNLVLEDKYDGRISAQRKELADDLTLVAKDFFASEWESSAVRTFMNQLRHLINGEGIQLDWNCEVLSSVAALVYKGDDWNKLLRFMQSQNMYNYRIALAMYGLLNGFANLTRDFTDILLNQNSTYVGEVYQEFYGQLFGCDICRDSMPNKEVLYPESQPQSQQHSQRTCHRSLTKMVLEFFNSSEFQYGRKKDTLLSELESALAQNFDNEDVQKFLDNLSKRPGWKKENKPYQLMRDKFAKPMIQTTLFQDNQDIETSSKEKSVVESSRGAAIRESKITEKVSSSLSFVTDPDAFRKIELLLPNDTQIKKQVKGDLSWFQGNYKEYFEDPKKGKKPGKYHGKPTDNPSVISHFERYCLRSQQPKSSAEIWTKVYKMIIKELKKIYQ